MRENNKIEHYKAYFPDVDLQSISDSQIEIWHPKNFNMQIMYFLNYLYSYKNRESEFIHIKASNLRDLLFVDLYDLNKNNKWINRNHNDREQQFHQRITYLRDERKFISFGISSKIRNGYIICITPKGADYLSEKSIVVGKDDFNDIRNLLSDIITNQLLANKELEKQIHDIINSLNANNKKSPADIINVINTIVSLTDSLPTVGSLFMDVAAKIIKFI